MPARSPAARGWEPGSRPVSQLTLGPKRNSHAATGTRCVAWIAGARVKAVIGPMNGEEPHGPTEGGGQGPKTTSRLRGTFSTEASRIKGTVRQPRRKNPVTP